MKNVLGQIVFLSKNKKKHFLISKIYLQVK